MNSPHLSSGQHFPVGMETTGKNPTWQVLGMPGHLMLWHSFEIKWFIWSVLQWEQLKSVLHRILKVCAKFQLFETSMLSTQWAPQQPSLGPPSMKRSGFVWKKCCFSLRLLELKFCLTAWIDGTAWVGWIGLVHGDKAWICTGHRRWRWTHFGLAGHRLCGLLTNTVLALVLKPLIKLIEKTRAVTSEGKNKMQFEGDLSGNILLTSRRMPSGSRHPDGKIRNPVGPFDWHNISSLVAA